MMWGRVERLGKRGRGKIRGRENKGQGRMRSLWGDKRGHRRGWIIGRTLPGGNVCNLVWMSMRVFVKDSLFDLQNNIFVKNAILWPAHVEGGPL